MQKRNAMSNMGYAIISVIVLGVIMIISTPMIIDSYKVGNKDNPQNPSDYQNREERHFRDRNDYNNSVGNVTERDVLDMRNKIRRIEIDFDSRIRELELNQREALSNNSSEQTQSSKGEISDKFVCTIEGNLDAEGNLIPLDSKSVMKSDKKQKIVFVCDYKE